LNTPETTPHSIPTNPATAPGHAFGKTPLKWFIVTPDFHHWHHTMEPEAIDHNYASHFPFLDYLFGTAVKPDRFPDEYGVRGGYVPPGFVRQQLFPFIWKG